MGLTRAALRVVLTTSPYLDNSKILLKEKSSNAVARNPPETRLVPLDSAEASLFVLMLAIRGAAPRGKFAAAPSTRHMC